MVMRRHYRFYSQDDRKEMYDGNERMSRRTDGIDKRYRRWYREEDGNERIIH